MAVILSEAKNLSVNRERRCPSLALRMTALGLLLFCRSAQASTLGVLILAHGGGPAWNRTVEDCVRQAHLSVPHRVVFGMGDSDPESYQSAVESLESGGAARIVSVPLLVSSHSEVYRQYEYLLRLRSAPAFPKPIPMSHGPTTMAMTPAHPLQLAVPVVLVPALDSCPFLPDILLDRAVDISRAPARETVILVAHGPNSERDDAWWQKSLASWAAAIRRQGRFKNVVGLTLRDDAPGPVRNRATERLREAVGRASRGGTALVVPILLASGGIEGGLEKRLEGLSCRIGRPILPDERISRWIRDRVERSLRLRSGQARLGESA